MEPGWKFNRIKKYPKICPNPVWGGDNPNQIASLPPPKKSLPSTSSHSSNVLTTLVPFCFYNHQLIFAIAVIPVVICDLLTCPPLC